MKNADTLTTDLHALLAHMETDVRFTADENAAMVLIHAKIAATTSTTKEDDLLIANCLKKYVCQNENY